jgi:hypothetical protein
LLKKNDYKKKIINKNKVIIIYKMSLIECQICIEEFKADNIFNCFACKFKNCITCHKKYLLSTSQYPHCINHECRAAIPYDIFLQKFNKKWIFNEYKMHRSNILLNREKAMLPEMVQQIAYEKDIIEKKNMYNKEIMELRKQIYEIERKISDLNIVKKEKSKYKFTYACPNTGCKGFLDEHFKCPLCESLVCKNCYVVKENDKNIEHICNPDLVETFNTIKKEAKPCPSCGEFISKISGCDQMFCVKCGTAFSWKTGLIEKNIIHNPHAHQFFQNNPEAREAYINQQNQHNQNNNCRQHIPNILQLQNVFKGISCEDNTYLTDTHRFISEFRHYRYDNFIRTLNNNLNQEDNLDIRKKYLNNEYNDKMFKSILHKREKHNFFIKQLYPLILFSYEFAETILWSIYDISEKYKIVSPMTNKTIGINSIGHEQIKKNIELLKQNSLNTLMNINNLKEDFGYTAQLIFGINYYFSYYH